MMLSCYCDHCHNDTCTIDKSEGLCFAGINRNETNQLVKRFYCLKRNFYIFQKIVCADTEVSIRRCCDDSSHCNKENLLPPDSEVLAHFANNNYNTNESDPISSLNHQTNQFHQHHSSLPSTTGASLFSTSNPLPLSLILLPGLILLSLLALIHYLVKRKRKKIKSNRKSYALESWKHTHCEDNCNNTCMNTNDKQINDCDLRTRPTQDRSISENSNRGTNTPRGNEDCVINIFRKPLINHNNSINISEEHDQINELSNQASQSGSQSFSQIHTDSRTSTSLTSRYSDKNNTSLKSLSDSNLEANYLSPRSIAHDIELVNQVGKGRFGTVWQGIHKGRPVAVKIFCSDGESLWEREKDIYITTLLRHRNILGFIAADARFEKHICSGYWLVTDYYPLGSIRDFLRQTTIETLVTLRMAHSIANGLDHLHTEILGAQGKPAIAHRDMKSTNILVRCDNTCCIADLGLAVRYNSTSTSIENPSRARVGTCRYLSPEIIENESNCRDFESLKASDIYAFALVIWEMLRRTKTISSSDQTNSFGTSSTSNKLVQDVNINTQPSLDQTKNSELLNSMKDISSVKLQNSNEPNVISLHSKEQKVADIGDSWIDGLTRKDQANREIVDSYLVPYQEYVSPEPTIEEMRQVVIEQKMRPPISFRWTKSEPLRQCVRLLYECWYEKPDARLTALRIRRRLAEIAMTHFQEDLDLHQ